ncbi:MAG: flagellar protein FliT [Lachnospiraceae bacterium]|nr:flagellar protein FliT [Lachnospiraceae bacterium]
MKNQYIAVLQQGLIKKVSLLDQIIVKNTLQKQLLSDPELDPDVLEENLNQKAELVDALVELDKGFEQVYERIREDLTENRMEYRTEIAAMKQYITQITEKSTQIQTQEQRNKDLMIQKFTTVKKQIREVKSNQKVVNQYYQNMMKLNYVDPQFMDNKK